MAAIRTEADEAHASNEELKEKVKTLEAENLTKEQEIKSLNHKLTVLETRSDTLEEDVKKHKGLADNSASHSTQNESLTRRLQVLEDEAEQADRNLRETNEKHVCRLA